jgi:hypothetical protein
VSRALVLGGRGEYLGGFELHQRAPLAGHLAELRPAAPDASGDGVVGTGEEAFFELEIGV